MNCCLICCLCGFVVCGLCWVGFRSCLGLFCLVLLVAGLFVVCEACCLVGCFGNVCLLVNDSYSYFSWGCLGFGLAALFWV